MMLGRFKALNADSSEESDVEGESPTITKEALEEKAMAQYMEALRAEKDEKWDEAEEMFRQLLESDIIVNTTGRVTFIGKRIKPSLAHLKYCCYMNLGHVLINKEEYEEGLQCYQKAIDLDGTDLNLWYKIAQTGMKMVNVNLAISAFQEVLEINPNHWPSLDTLVTAMYAEGGHMNCLYYISQCLQRKPRYRKGLALKHKIFMDHPTLKLHYNLFHPDNKLDTEPLKVGEDITEEEIDKYFQEVIDLRERCRAKRTKPPEKIKTEHCIEIRPTTWCQLARILLNTYAQFEEETSTHEFFRPVNLISAPFSPNTNIDLEMEVEEEIKDQSADEEVDKINNEGAANENEEVSENLGVRAKRRRSSPTYLEQWMSGKRRSARVRSTARKEVEPSLAQTLADLLPPRYLPEKGDGKIEGLRWCEDSMDTMDVYRLFENKDGGATDPLSNSDLVYSLSSEERERLIKEENYFGTSKETSDVTQFLNDQTGQTIVRMMTAFTEELGSKWNLHWPVNLPSLYIQIHKLHLFHNPRMTASKHIMTQKECDAMLLYGELVLNQWLCYGKDEDKPSPLGGSWFGGDFPSLSLGDLEDTVKRQDDVTLYCRFYWMAALMHLYKGGLQGPIWTLDCLANYPKLDTVQIRLVNVVNHYLINKHTVELLFVSLLRKEVLDKVPEFYENEQYDLMIDVLSKALDPEAKALKLGVTTPDIDRQSQFSLLLEAYWQTKNFKECFVWGEVCIYEAFSHYRATLSAEENNTERAKWASVITSTLQGILACVDDDGLEVVGVLDDSKTVRLVQTLTNIICQQMEGGESDGIETTAPWILLYYVVRHEEETNKGKHPTNKEEEEMPRSLYLLFTAHDYLGRRAWCCMDDAAVLYKTLTVLELSLKSAAEGSEYMIMLKQQLEQILYCLYGHPIKRNKPRYVQEHNVDGLALTWTRSYQAFNFLRPKELPTYDSSSRHSISADTEALFKRIIGLVPAECNPARLVDAMTQYIESSTDTIPENDNPLPTEMTDIYYLIADHNFKNKTWGKALRYYLLDVCNSPGRVDSWACLALARGSQLETKLNSCDPLKSEADFLKRAMMSCRCYSTCLDLDPGLSTVWIEYGSFSYMVHSFCSRLLKQEQNLSLEMFDILEKNKEGMLETAFKCFTSANGLFYADGGAEVQDERWLHHYMLGKIAEKKQEPPNIYLQHYIKSMKFLHENNVPYPDHVSYTSPQNLAVEALELYYRIHACILKFLEQSEEKPVDIHMRKLFLDIVEKAASGPFVSQTRLSDTDDARRKTAVDASEENRISVIQNLLDDLITQIVTAETVFNKRNSDSVENDSKRLKKSTESEKLKSETQNDGEEDDENDSAEEERKASQPKSSESSSESSDSESTSSDTSSASSSDDDSDDSTSAVSDQEASQSKHETDTKVPKEEKKDENWKQEQEILTGRCLAALQECVRRFPEHYKSLYRLAYFYFRSKLQRDPSKSKQLLLGDKGLFKDRRPNNFFNGVWRIPSNDIDRPGSFAAHMNRCVLLLMDLLRESKDSKMLLDLALQLKDTPEPDKKYLRDPEREELCREALSLSVQALRKKLQEVKTNTLVKSVLMEAFKAYKRVNKAWPQRDGPFSTVVTDAYTKLKDEKIESGQLLDTALKFCSQELIQRNTASIVQPVAPSLTITTTAASAVAPSAPSTFVTAATVVPTTTPIPTSSATPVPTVPEQQANQSASVPPTPPPPVPTTQKSPFPMVPKRPRGRPSNVSIRHPSPSTQQKQSLQSARNPVEDMAAFYRNLASLSDPRLLMQAASLMNPLTSAAMSLQSQWNYLQSAELLRQVQLAQSTLPSLQALKERPNLSVTPLATAPTPQPKPSTSIPKYPNPSSVQKSNQSSKASMSKSPSSFLSALQQLQQVSAASVKPSTSNVPVSSGKPPVSVLRPPLPATPLAGTSLVPPRLPPQTTMLNRPPLPTSVPQSVASTSSAGNYSAKQPEMSLQQKLSAKRNKATASKDSTMVIDLDKGAAATKLSQSRNLLDIAKTVGDGKYTGTSSGLSISKVPTKPVQPDMKLMSSLSILPVTSIKNVMSSLSPKEITVTKVTPQPVKQSEPKLGTSRSNDSITVSVIDSMGSKKSADAGSSSSKLMSYRKPSSSKSENDVVSTLLSMGSNVTITPTVTTKTSTQTKQLPKTDLSIVPGRQQQPQQHQQQQPQQHQQQPQQHQQQQQQLTQQQKDQRSKSGLDVIVLDD